MNVKVKTIPLLLVLLVLIASCARDEMPGIEVEEIDAASFVEEYWPTEGWRESTPAAQGMDPVILQEMMNVIEGGGVSIDGLVVVRNGYIVAEKYFDPYEEETKHGIYSVTKSILSALIGIAIEKGYIYSVHDTVLDYFPGRKFKNDGIIKRSITVEHLLTMTAGLHFDWDEMIWSQDHVQYVLDQPMKANPGEKFNYSNGNAHVLSALLQESSGFNAFEFAKLYLFEPLGIEDVEWKTDNLGISKGGLGMRMIPRDMAKIGYLYLRQGDWGGKQIIPADWIDASTRKYIQVPDPLEPWDLYLGYYWWLHEDDMYAAHGMKGQFIYVIPAYDLVVVITSHVQDSKFVQPQHLIREYIVPAVKG